MMYRKKAVSVEARQVNLANLDQVAKWCNGIVRRREDNFSPRIQIMTLEGVVTAQLGDWVIKGVMGEFYPCRDDIFQMTYEPVNEKEV